MLFGIRAAGLRFQTVYAQTYCEGDQQRHEHGSAWISSDPFAGVCEESTRLCKNRLVL